MRQKSPAMAPLAFPAQMRAMCVAQASTQQGRAQHTIIAMVYHMPLALPAQARAMCVA